MNYQLFYNQVSQRIEKLRRKKGITQEALAAKAGLHHAYFSEIVQGRNITIKTAYNIARALDIPISELFDFD